ncbi:hypothetical protein Scep_017651 [Stephania cephalantha]|uniref:Protein misato homolog 1 n=1 Tax=Stephania cephalantha TaxID=152367 RepID=A0AAP0NUF3_9MAGN
MKEIVTIQVGGFANFIGSHFWNFQDDLLGLAEDSQADPVYRNQSLNMDVLYRAGETQQGASTYTPRLVSIDFQGSLGSLSSRGSLYNSAPSSDPLHISTWTGNVSRQVSEPHKKNLFLQSLYEEELEKPTSSVDGPHKFKDEDLVECLQSGVQFWTDFSKVHFHPQSLYEVSGLYVDPEDFNNYGIGKSVFSGGLHGEEITERLRFFVEECDCIQGIQFIVDDSGGFTGVASDFLENIADEYSNTPVLLYSARSPGSCTRPMNRNDSILRSLHDAISFSKFSSYCNLIVPIGSPSISKSKATTTLNINDENLFHCSGVYAAALHSTTLPLRLEPPGPAVESQYVTGALDFNRFVTMLACQGRQNIVATLDVAMPAPPLTGNLDQHSFLESLYSLTPELNEDAEDSQAVESMTVHGALHAGGNRASILEVKDSISSAYKSASTRPLFSHLSAALCPLPIPLPFPSMFRNHVSQSGLLLDKPISRSQSRTSLDVHSIPMAARLRSSNAVLPYIEKRLGNLRKLGIQRGSPGTGLLQSWGLEKEEVEDMGEVLSKMVQALNPRPEESSDSD